MEVPGNTEYRVLFLNATLRNGSVASDPRLIDFTDRHTISLRPVAPKRIFSPLAEVRRPDIQGVVISMSTGLPDMDQLRFAESVLSQRRRVWFYWPGESAIESVDRECIRSYFRHFMAAKVWETVRPAARVGYNIATKLSKLTAPVVDDPVFATCDTELEQIIAAAKPVPFHTAEAPSGVAPMAGVGFYLRTDYWAPLTSGGSYGHTCYLAKALARTVQQLICFTPSHYPLLTELGVSEIPLPSAGIYMSERDYFAANTHYYRLLRLAVEVAKPAFIYERLCLGNYCGARLSQQFGIPYIVEYNGSEIEMSRLFAGHTFQHERLLIKAEQAAFQQATVISVVSEPLKDDLVSRGIASSKILVNPNGVDPAEYSPRSESERKTVRQELGFDDNHMVVGFTGTFGGWHGIDVLAEALPQICKRNSQVRFLLVGDGSYKHLVDSAINQHSLEDRVVCTGRVQQQDGARLLGACDIFVSPHSRTMSSGRFFGSPTKIFEYMAMGRGIAASDLDQIGQILSPALRASDLNGSAAAVSDARAILCKPGDVSEFSKAVEYLVRHPNAGKALGDNARAAALSEHTWDAHLQRLWRFSAVGSSTNTPLTDSPPIGVTSDVSQRIRQQWERAGINARDPTRPGASDDAGTRSARLQGYTGRKVLEIGRGVDTKLIPLAECGAEVTYFNPSKLAEEADHLPFSEETFDLVLCPNISNLPRASKLVKEIARILKAGGTAFAAADAEHSYYHWGTQFFRIGLVSGLLTQYSLAEILSRDIQSSANPGSRIMRPYSRSGVRELFSPFQCVRIRRSGRTLILSATK